MIKTDKNKSIWTRVFVSTIFIMVLTCLSNTFVSLFDGIVTSTTIGDIGTASLTLSNTVDKATLAIGELFAVGCQIILTKYLVAGNKQKAIGTFNLMLIISISIGFILLIINLSCYKFLPIALSAGMNVSQSVLDSSSYYLFGFSIGIPFIIFNQLMIPIIYIDGEKRLAKISIILSILSNCGFCLLLVNFLNNKIFGVGLSTTLSAILISLILLIYFFKKKSTFKIKFRYIKYGNLKDVLVNGAPMAFKYLVIALKLFLLNIIMISVGNIVGKDQGQILLTARGAQSTISIIFESPVTAILLTTILMGGFYFNEENDYDLKKYNKNTLMFIVTFILPLSLIYFFVSPYLAVAYLPKESTSIDLCVFGMRWNAFGIIFLALNSAILGYMQAFRNKALTFISISLQSLILPIVFVSAFGFTLGSKGVFIGLFANILAFIPIYLIINCIVNKKLPKNFNDFFFLSNDFGFNKNNQINISLLSKKDLNYLKNKLVVFYKNNKTPKSKQKRISKGINTLSLFMLKNKNCKFLTNIRITYKNNVVSLIVSNNLPKLDFNNINFSKIMNKDLYGASGEIKYNYFLKTNNIILSY